MTRFVIDAGVALQVAKGEIVPSQTHQLLAPTLLRSQVLDRLYDQVRSGELGEEAGLELNTRFGKLKIRYLGDAVLRRRAWALATRLKLLSTYPAEYLALTQLQADALVAEDPDLIGRAGQLVEIARPLALTH